MRTMQLDPCPFTAKDRVVTKQRVAAAARSIKRQRDKLPLFADQLDLTPEEKISRDDANANEHRLKLRALWLETARELHRLFRQFPPRLQAHIVREWGSCAYPKTPSYALEWLKAQGYITSHGQLINGRFIVTHELQIEAISRWPQRPGSTARRAIAPRQLSHNS